MTPGEWNRTLSTHLIHGEVTNEETRHPPRQKSHYRGAVPEKRTAPGDAFAQNEAILLLNALAYDVTHAARVLMETASGEGWSLMRLRERVLRVAARILVHGWRATGQDSNGTEGASVGDLS